MMARCEGNEIEVLDRVFLPHSLGSVYTMICEFIGYTKYGDEGKVMGLAPYGKDTYCDQIAKIVTPKNGGFQLDLNYFKPLGSNQGMQVLPDGTVRLARHFSDRMEELFGEPRKPHAEITQRDMDLAFALQHRFEEIFFHLLNRLHKRVPLDETCHGRWMRAQQRRQRQTLRSHVLSPNLHSARRRGRRTCHRRRTAHLSFRAQAASSARIEKLLPGSRVFRLAHPVGPAERGPGISQAGTRARCSKKLRSRLPREMWSAGFRDAWSGDRARSAIARSWRIPACRT